MFQDTGVFDDGRSTVFDDKDLLEDTNLLSVQDLTNWATFRDLLPNETESQSCVSDSDDLTIGKNDIRRYFPRMFMSIINCGEFSYVQNFLQTFITKTCDFTSSISVSTSFLIPPILTVRGPQHLMHYLLGLHVMYPDLVVKMTRYQIIPSKTFDTTIIIYVEFNMTKTCHIPNELWCPPDEILQSLYTAKNPERVARILRIYRSMKLHPSMFHNVSIQSTVDMVDHSTIGGSSAPVLTRQRSCTYPPEPPPVINNNNCRKPTICVPEHYVRTLHVSAQLLPQPKHLRLQGQFEFCMDKYNHVTALLFQAKEIE